MMIQHTMSISMPIIPMPSIPMPSIPMPSAPSPIPTSCLGQSALVVEPRSARGFGFGLHGTGKDLAGMTHNHAYWTTGTKAVHFQRWKSAM